MPMSELANSAPRMNPKMPSTNRKMPVARETRTAARRRAGTTAAGIWKEAGSMPADYMMAPCPNRRPRRPLTAAGLLTHGGSLRCSCGGAGSVGPARDRDRVPRRSAGDSAGSSLLGGAAVRGARGSVGAVPRAAAPARDSSTRSRRSCAGTRSGNLTAARPDRRRAGQGGVRPRQTCRSAPR